MNIDTTPFRRWGRRAAGLAAAALILAGSAGGVMAASPAPGTSTTTTAKAPDGVCAAQWQAAKADPTVATLRALGDCEVGRRFVTLTHLTTVVDAAPALTGAHRTALLAVIGRTHDGLASLQATIDGDTTVAALRADLPKIARDYRVYLLVAPQVHLTRAADAGQAAADRLDVVALKLQDWIDRERSNGKNVQAAQAALTAMEHETALAEAQIGPVADRILPLTPADWNAGHASPILDAARDSLRAARNELQGARNDAQACIDDLK